MHARAEALQATLAASRGQATKLPRSRKVDGRFVIDPELFPDYVDHLKGGFSVIMKWRRSMRGQTAPLPPPDELEKLLPVSKPSKALLTSPPAELCQATWLGHASVLTQWEGWTVLADPIFSERCSPLQCAGPRRVRPSPVQTDDLPRVDAIIISHSHYDHLDTNTVRALAKSQPTALFFVPLGMKKWFRSNCPAAACVEFDWGDVLQLEDEAAGGAAPRPPLQLVCVPCQHWCKRTLNDTNTVLWCSWIVRTDRLSYYFGGDTGYSGQMFRTAGEAYGPIDLCAIPIGAEGAPAERWFHKPNHMDPAEAVACHIDLCSRQSIGIHWGTFPLTGEHIMDPPKKLAEALTRCALPADSFLAMAHGEVRSFDLLRAHECDGRVNGPSRGDAEALSG